MLRGPGNREQACSYGGIALAVVALVLAGCALTNISELTKALAQDPASVCVRVTSIYGTAMVSRTNAHNGTVSCTGDGLTVKSQ